MKAIVRMVVLFSLVLSVQSVAAQTIPSWKLKDLQAAMQTDKPTVINFWATFCKPCIEELPHFMELAKQYKKEGVEFIFVNLDVKEAYPKKISAFINKRGLKEKVVFLNETDADLFCPAVDARWSGAIPATVFINNKAGYKNFVEDQLTKEQLEKEIKLLLGSN